MEYHIQLAVFWVVLAWCSMAVILVRWLFLNLLFNPGLFGQLCLYSSQHLDISQFPLYVKIVYTHSLFFPEFDMIHYHAIQVQKENIITLI